MTVHPHVIVAHVRFKPLKPGIVKVGDSNVTAGLKVILGLVNQGLPLRIDHGKGVGKKNGIHRGLKGLLSFLIRFFEERYPVTDTAQLFFGNAQHIMGHI